MNIKANVKVGKSMFQLEPQEGKIKDQMFETIELMTVLENTPEKCDLCGSDKVSWRAMKTKEKGYKYINIVCNGCGANATIGERQEDGGLFWRQSENGKMFSKFEK